MLYAYLFSVKYAFPHKHLKAKRHSHRESCIECEVLSQTFFTNQQTKANNTNRCGKKNWNETICVNTLSAVSVVAGLFSNSFSLMLPHNVACFLSGLITRLDSQLATGRKQATL